MGRSAKSPLPVMICLIVLAVGGCGSQSETDSVEMSSVETGNVETCSTEKDGAAQNSALKGSEKKDREEELTVIYDDLYRKALAFCLSDEQEVMKTVLEGLGELGYAAVDEKNQINMKEAEKVMQFCQSVAEEETANLEIVTASYAGGFTKYKLNTKAGKVDVIREFYQYDKEGNLKNMETVHYPAERWEYTKEGYLIFEGNYYSDSQYALTLSDTPEQTMLRVEPLEEKCRELNRRYLLPIGYARNNLFLIDWNEEDFGELNFYDLFDGFYPFQSDVPLFSVLREEPGTEGWYRIPQEVFEAVVMAHFSVDRELLQAKTIYLSEDRAYQYRPRGIDDREYSEVPYPEVVGCQENMDGTITLTVNAVYPNDSTSRAFSHETVVRPVGENNFQYVSNKITDLEEGSLWWHSDRLTGE